MLVSFPLAFYTATLVAYIVYAVGGSMFVFRFGVVCNIAGAGMAFLAALPGFVDWGVGIPTGTPAKRDGITHMLLNVIALVIFVINAVIQTGRWNLTAPSWLSGVVLAAVGLIITHIAASVGWMLVQTHHVGVVLTPEQERLEPRPTTPAPEERAPAS